MKKEIKNITKESFCKYGYVLEHDFQEGENFKIVLDEKRQVGWRLAISQVKDNKIVKVARHPNTMETFDPLKGVAMLCVAPAEEPANIEIFLLDKPVCVEKNIWHALFTLSESALVKICENTEVESEMYELKDSISIYAGC